MQFWVWVKVCDNVVVFCWTLSVAAAAASSTQVTHTKLILLIRSLFTHCQVQQQPFNTSQDSKFAAAAATLDFACQSSRDGSKSRNMNPGIFREKALKTVRIWILICIPSSCKKISFSTQLLVTKMEIYFQPPKTKKAFYESFFISWLFSRRILERYLFVLLKECQSIGIESSL